MDFRSVEIFDSIGLFSVADSSTLDSTLTVSMTEDSAILNWSTTGATSTSATSFTEDLSSIFFSSESTATDWISAGEEELALSASFNSTSTIT